MRFYDTIFAEKKVKLDLIDKKILAQLAIDARAPLSQISKKVHISRDTVAYRTNNLKKTGVLQGTRTLIDISKFGLINLHMFLQLQQPEKSKEQELIKNLRAFQFLRAIIKFNGKYDFELALVAESLKEADQYITKICEVCGDYLIKYDVLFITETFVANTFPRRFYSFEQETKIKEIKKEKIDEKDIELLELIGEQADAPLYQLAKDINLSTDAVTYRLKKLKKSGIILGYIPAINYDSIHYTVYALLLSIKNFDKSTQSKLKEFLRTNKDILWAVKTIGSYNLFLYICTETPNNFLKTTEELRAQLINKLSAYEMLINLEEYKYTYVPKGLLNSPKPVE